MIACEGLEYRVGRFQLSRVDFAIAGGAYAVLRGPTGAGKTTLLELLCGLRRPSAGRIVIDGRDVTGVSPAGRRVAYVPQDLALFPTINVFGHLEFAMRIRRIPRRQRVDRVEALAARLGIAHLLKRSVGNLSGGEAQRVALGRALAAEPAALLLDEPFSALDDRTKHEMYDLIEQVMADGNVTTLHVTHQREEAKRLGTQQWHLEEGVLRLVTPQPGGMREADR